MASSSAEVPYNQQAENVLFGHNVIEKILDTCLGQDGKRYYQVKWRESWEPEERLMSACEDALQVFWKEYYANVEQEIRKQVSASKTLLTTPTPTPSDLISVDASNEIDSGSHDTNTITSNITSTNISDSTATDDIPDEISNGTILNDAKLQSILPPVVLSMGSLTNTSATVNFVDSFPEQSATVAYYAVESSNEHNQETEPLVAQLDISSQAQILTQLMSTAPDLPSHSYPSDTEQQQHSSTMIRADTMSTKKVGAPDANSKYHCDVCTRTFASKRNVQRHMLSHTGEKPWMCEFCFKRFRQKPHLEQHVNIHKGIKNAVCKICGKAFNHRSNLVTHMATHSTARPHQCEICGENFKLKHTLAKHLMVHTKPEVEKRHQCKFCKRCFRDKSYLAEHETIHQQKKPWMCDICNKSFSFKRRYQLHMEMHQAKDGGCEFVCHLCSKTFKTKAFLARHVEKHTKTKRKKRRKKVKTDVSNVQPEKTSDVVEEDVDVTTEIDPEEGDSLSLNSTINDEVLEEDLDEAEEEPEDEQPGHQQLEPQQRQRIQIHRTDNQHVIHVDATNEQQNVTTTTSNMVVANMLNQLNMEEEATYVTLAQLTQAAMDNPPCDEQGNVILMKYEDMQKNLQAIQQQHEQHQAVDIGMGTLQMGTSHEGGLHVVLNTGGHGTEHGEFGGEPGSVGALVLSAHGVHLPNLDDMDVSLTGSINTMNS